MKAKIGIGIIIIAFLVCLNPYLLIFGIPLFIIGIIILLLSDKKLKTKLIWILTPIILWYPTMHLFFYLMGTIGTATAQKLDLIFPENFKGKAIVVSDMPCGEEIEIIDDREQLRIPENGILLYKGNLKSGYINNRYFRIDSEEKKTEIPFRANYMYWEDSENKPDESVIGIWLSGGGTSYNPSPNGGINYSFREFVISSKDSLKKWSEFKRSRELERITDSLVAKCKNKN
ncbi:hypothetical protein [uncultured Psychroserpens sp.]|uniref:DUF6843 domain-containing protein n=1 Tax=uncultured Psychroserpens sp. TaxID=255436 RepID=UPI0026261BA8|nr:hypothetical protein [uncultured Psychroserpens sp.]